MVAIASFYRLFLKQIALIVVLNYTHAPIPNYFQFIFTPFYAVIQHGEGLVWFLV